MEDHTYKRINCLERRIWAIGAVLREVLQGLKSIGRTEIRKI